MQERITRRWRAVKRAARQEGLPGLYHLAHRSLRMLRCAPQKRAQLRRRAAETAAYPAWLAAHLPTQAELAAQRQMVFHHRLSFLIPVWNTDPACLLALADSLLQQSCPAWEAVFYDGCSTRPETRAALDMLTDSRFRVIHGTENLRIAGNTNLAAQAATGDYIALCDHDDLLTADAVCQVLLAAEQGADFIYSDEDKCDAAGTRFFEPHFKPDFAPDSLRSGNYICHLMAMKASLFHAVGGMNPACDGSQDHDLALRATERAEKITHIRRILYHWRMLDTSFSHVRLEQCVDAATRAVNDQLERLRLPGEAFNEQLLIRTRWPLPADAAVALVVHGDGAVSGQWLRRLTHNQPLIREIFCVGAKPPASCRRAESIPDAVRQSHCALILLLRGGLEPLTDGWLTELFGQAARPDIGCVGAPVVDAHLCYRTDGLAMLDGRIVHRHAGEFSLGPTWQLTDRIVQNVTAVSAACLMARREVLLGLAEPFTGWSAGLHALESGLHNIVTPWAMMRSKSPLPPETGEKNVQPVTECYWRGEYDCTSPANQV